MAETTERGGVIRETRVFLAACVRYALARGKLAAMESKEAGGHVLKLIALVVVALALLVFAWFFVCLSFVFLLAKALGGENAWLWASLIMAGAHIGLAVLLVLMAKTGLGKSLFPLTAEE